MGPPFSRHIHKYANFVPNYNPSLYIYLKFRFFKIYYGYFHAFLYSIIVAPIIIIYDFNQSILKTIRQWTDTLSLNHALKHGTSQHTSTYHAYSSLSSFFIYDYLSYFLHNTIIIMIVYEMFKGVHESWCKYMSFMSISFHQVYSIRFHVHTSLLFDFAYQN